MAFQSVDRTVELVARYIRGADPESADWPVINVHHWKRDLGWLDATMVSLANEYVAWWETYLKAQTPSNMRLYDVSVRDIENEFGSVVTVVPDIVGTDASDQVLPVLSALVKWVCDPGAAPRRGKTFWGGLTEADLSGDTIIAGSITYLEAAFDALRAVDVTNTAALGIVSRYHGFTLVERPDGTVFKKPALRDPALFNTIASVTVADTVATQERRRRGG